MPTDKLPSNQARAPSISKNISSHVSEYLAFSFLDEADTLRNTSLLEFNADSVRSSCKLCQPIGSRFRLGQHPVDLFIVLVGDGWAALDYGTSNVVHSRHTSVYVAVPINRPGPLAINM